MSFYLLDLIWHEQENVFLQNWLSWSWQGAVVEEVKTHRIRRPADTGHNLVSAFTDNIFISSQGEMMLDWRR